MVIFSEGLAKVAEQYLRKGSKVYLEGALQTRKWQDQSGQDKYSTEVVLQGFNSNLTMLDGRSEGGGDSVGFSGPPAARSEGRRRRRAPRRSNPPEWTTTFRSDPANERAARGRPLNFRRWGRPISPW